MEIKGLIFSSLVEYKGEFKTVSELFNISNSKQWDPIKLNEEWALRFGFERGVTMLRGGTSQTISFQLGNSNYLEYEDGEINILNEFSHVGAIFQIEYVHQLQNLYLTLTGEELTLICSCIYQTTESGIKTKVIECNNCKQKKLKE